MVADSDTYANSLVQLILYANTPFGAKTAFALVAVVVMGIAHACLNSGNPLLADVASVHNSRTYVVDIQAVVTVIVV